jgi:hypothetical protein
MKRAVQAMNKSQSGLSELFKRIKRYVRDVDKIKIFGRQFKLSDVKKGACMVRTTPVKAHRGNNFSVILGASGSGKSVYAYTRFADDHFITGNDALFTCMLISADSICPDVDQLNIDSFIKSLGNNITYVVGNIINAAVNEEVRKHQKTTLMQYKQHDDSWNFVPFQNDDRSIVLCIVIDEAGTI